jgi:hypothetical protein
MVRRNFTSFALLLFNIIMQFSNHFNTMKKHTYTLFSLLALLIVISGCSNGDLKQRVSDLEGRVAALEAKNNPVRPTANPATPQTQPDVKPDGPLPAFSFVEEEFDFGTIQEGDVVEHTFKFKNVGEAPLIISNARATCGCTVPKWPNEPRPVGGEGEILVRFDSKNKKGNQNKTITLTANTYPTTNKIRIKALVAQEAEG